MAVRLPARCWVQVDGPGVRGCAGTGQRDGNPLASPSNEQPSDNDDEAKVGDLVEAISR